MAVMSNDLWPLLKQLGVPDHTISFTLTVSVGQVVTAEAVYYPSLDLKEDGELATAIKRYRLVEVDEDGDG